MGMEDQVRVLGIQVIAGPDADDEEVAEATAELRRSLLDLDLSSVEQVLLRGEPPPGSKGTGSAELGTLVVTVANSPPLAAVIGTVTSWLLGSRRRKVKLVLNGDVLELTGVSSDEQRRLTDEWLRRQQG